MSLLKRGTLERPREQRFAATGREFSRVRVGVSQNRKPPGFGNELASFLSDPRKAAFPPEAQRQRQKTGSGQEPNHELD